MLEVETTATGVRARQTRCHLEGKRGAVVARRVCNALCEGALRCSVVTPRVHVRCSVLTAGRDDPQGEEKSGDKAEPTPRRSFRQDNGVNTACELKLLLRIPASRASSASRAVAVASGAAERVENHFARFFRRWTCQLVHGCDSSSLCDLAFEENNIVHKFQGFICHDLIKVWTLTKVICYLWSP